MQAQLFDAPRATDLGGSGLLLGAALMLAYFLLSAALFQDYSRAAPPPLAGETTILVIAR